MAKKQIALLICCMVLLVSCGGVSPRTEQPDPGNRDPFPNGVWREKVGEYPFDLEIADLNGDGLKDLLVMIHGDAMLVYTNRGNRKFELTQRVTEVGWHPTGLRAWDRTGNGVADMVFAACEQRRTLQRYLVNPDGTLTFDHELEIGVFVYGLEIGDLDGDGHIDVVMGNGPGGMAHYVVVVWGADTDHQHVQVIKTRNWRTLFPKIGDVNNDGKPDIVVMNSERARLSIFLNQGDRTFKEQIIEVLPGVSREVELADLDWDGNLDYLLPYEVGRGALIVYNNGTGLEERREEIIAPSFGFRFGNVYRDDRFILMGLAEERRVFFTGKARGETTWRPLVEVPAGSIPWRFRYADLDNNGRLDAAFLNSNSEELQIVWDVMRLLEK